MNNDLISREALKKAIKNSFKHNLNGYDALLISEIDEFINNAPTVCGNNPKWCESCVSKGKCASTRPKGEWKTNLTTGDIFCSCCKEVRRDTRIKHINFCNSCGADMRGGAE